MNNRNYEIKVRLTQAERVHLTRLVSASGLSRETYLRKLISGVVPKEAPPPDFFAMCGSCITSGTTSTKSL